MARAPKKSAIQPRSVWNDTSVVDNPDSPAHRKEVSSLKWKRRALFVIAFGGVPLMVFMGAGMMAQATTPVTSDHAAVSAAANSSKGKSEAFRALQEWISTDPSPLPGGVIISWDGFETELPPAPTTEEEKAAALSYVFETHTFTVARGESMWHADIQITVDDILGATVTSPPSLTPIPLAEVIPRDPWFSLLSASPTPAVTQAVEAWSAAYAGGSSDALHQIVQDRDAGRSYLPLYGVQELVSTKIIAAGSPIDEEGAAVTDVLILRAEIGFWWKGGKPVVASNQQMPSPTPVSYDLLVIHADTATPVVVAWGPPGSGPSLVAYQNAIAAKISDPKATLEEGAPGGASEPATDAGDSIDEPAEGGDR